MKKQKTIRWHKDRAWKEFSLYIRLKYSDWRGNCKCVTCGKVDHYKKMQGGHFVQGRHNATLFDERNVHPQCYACNCMKYGNLIEYYPFMLKTYGQEVIDELKEMDKENRKFTREELDDIRDKFIKKRKKYE